MNKKELIKRVSRMCGLNRANTEKAVNCVFDAITDALVDGERVQLTGIGTLFIKSRRAYEMKNPRTKKSVPIPETRAIGFNISKAMKQQLNKQDK
jgi:nucleoid DNA-binding protein